MKLILFVLCIILSAALIQSQMPFILYQNRICSGIYGKESIPGAFQDGAIIITPTSNSRGTASFVIYNYEDEGKLGKLVNEDIASFICTSIGVELGLCKREEIGKFLVKDGPTSASIQTELVDFSKVTFPFNITYTVPHTGLYCFIALSSPGSEQQGVLDIGVAFKNPFGWLPGVHYPKLLFYGVTTLVYIFVFCAWMLKSFFHWQDILPIQKYISGVVFFLIIETGMQWEYWNYINIVGHRSGFILAITAILNAVRNSVSFFILLIVSMGYGVVKPSLGDKMKKCQALAVVHCIFGTIYAAGTLHTDDRQQEPSAWLVFFCVVPLAATMAIFYLWTLSSLAETTRHLEVRRQHVKLLMYRRVWKLLVFVAINLCLFFVANALYFSQRSTMDVIAKWWRYRWFFQDGWLNLLYTISMLTICILWRPTTNNQRYGLVELSSEDADFDMDDFLNDVAVEHMDGNVKRREGAYSDMEDNDIFAVHGYDSDPDEVSLSPKRDQSPVRSRGSTPMRDNNANTD